MFTAEQAAVWAFLLFLRHVLFKNVCVGKYMSFLVNTCLIFVQYLSMFVNTRYCVIGIIYSHICTYLCSSIDDSTCHDVRVESKVDPFALRSLRATIIERCDCDVFRFTAVYIYIYIYKHMYIYMYICVYTHTDTNGSL